MTAFHASRARLRTAAATVGIGLLTVALTTSPSASAAPSGDAGPARTPTKTRLLDALLRGDSPTPPARAARRSAAAASPVAPATPSFAGATKAAAVQGAGATTCDALALDWTLGYDGVTLSWTSGAAGPYTVQRLREGASPVTIGTAFEGLEFTEEVNTEGIARYRVIPADGTVCETPDLTMSSEDGYGEPEAVVGMIRPDGGPEGMLLQDSWSLGRSTQLEGVDPSFSPDGRRVVGSIEVGPMTRVLAVRTVFHAPELLRSSGPADSLALDPEWSRDGLRIAYTRYSVDPTTHDVTGTELRVLDVRTGADRSVAGSAGLIQPEWVTDTQLVAAGLSAGSGLSYIPAAGGTPSPIAGTANAAQPDMGAQTSRIWFVSDDGTTSRISAVVRDGGDQVGTVRESTTVVYDQPRSTDRDFDTFNGASPTRRFHVEVGPGADPADPADDTFVVVEDDFANPTRDTPIGVAREGLGGPWGFDLRRPASKGTSDLTGDGSGDLIARDSAGRMWIYPFTPSAPAGPRVLLGTGWGIYDSFIVAGDLTGDGRADILARDRAGVLWRYDGRGNGKVTPRVKIGTGWGGYLLVAPGDWGRDGLADIIARSPSGELWQYPAKPGGALGPRTRLGTGWNTMNAVIGSGDFDLDGDADLLAREATTGTLWLYPSDVAARSGFAPRRKVGTGWNVFTQLSSPEIIGGSPVVHGVNRAGELLLYRVVGNGRFDPNEVYRIGTGWQTYTVGP